MNGEQIITLNGKERRVRGGLTLSELIAELDLQDRLVVVERNGQIVTRPAYANTSIEAGDVLEIVHFVGGG
jgi:thiamine biosynthesis protein ThiS